MVPGAVIDTAPDIGYRVLRAEFGSTEEVMVGFVKGKAPLDPPVEGGRLDRRKGVDKVAIFRVGGVEMGSHTYDEEGAGVVLACSYSGVVNYGVGVEEEGLADFNGLGSGRGGKHPVGTSLSREG